MRVVALTGDLMDRSRISAAITDIVFAGEATACRGADTVIIDLAGHAAVVDAVRRAAPDAWIVAYGAHVDDETLARATGDGADVALPRSRFFRDPGAAIAPAV